MMPLSPVRNLSKWQIPWWRHDVIVCVRSKMTTWGDRSTVGSQNSVWNWSAICHQKAVCKLSAVGDQSADRSGIWDQNTDWSRVCELIAAGCRKLRRDGNGSGDVHTELWCWSILHRSNLQYECTMNEYLKYNDKMCSNYNLKNGFDNVTHTMCYGTSEFMAWFDLTWQGQFVCKMLKPINWHIFWYLYDPIAYSNTTVNN